MDPIAHFPQGDSAKDRTGLDLVDWPFGPPRPAPMPFFLLLVLTSYWGIVAFCFTRIVSIEPKFYFFPGWWLEKETDGLINLTLSANLILLAGTLVVALVLGKQKWRDFGWRHEALLPGILWGLAAFIGVVAIQVLLLMERGNSIVLEPRWTREPMAAAGGWLGQLFGNCLFEETAFRGLLLAQTYWIVESLRSRGGVRAGAASTLFWAFLFSQAFFAVIHIPGNLSKGFPWSMLWGQFGAGLLLAWVYWRSKNLFFTVMLHALCNFEVPIFKETWHGGLIAGIAILIGMIGWEIWLKAAPKPGPVPSPVVPPAPPSEAGTSATG